MTEHGLLAHLTGPDHAISIEELEFRATVNPDYLTALRVIHLTNSGCPIPVARPHRHNYDLAQGPWEREP